jgi:hypothetical protein
MSMGMDGNRSRMFKVLAPIEKKGGGTYWLRVGSAFPNKDGSTNLYMDAWPSGTSRLQLREMTDEDFARKREHGDHAASSPPEPPPF